MRKAHKNFFGYDYTMEIKRLLLRQSWQRIRSSQFIDFLLYLDELGEFGTISEGGLPVLQFVGFFGERFLQVRGDFDCAVDKVDDFDEFLFFEATRCHGGSSDSDTTGVNGARIYILPKSRVKVTAWEGILVEGDADCLEDTFGTCAIGTLGLGGEENHV